MHGHGCNGGATPHAMRGGPPGAADPSALGGVRGMRTSAGVRGSAYAPPAMQQHLAAAAAAGGGWQPQQMHSAQGSAEYGGHGGSCAHATHAAHAQHRLHQPAPVHFAAELMRLGFGERASVDAMFDLEIDAQVFSAHDVERAVLWITAKESAEASLVKLTEDDDF
jgi:hypothetical protein